MSCPRPEELSRLIAGGIDSELRAHLATCDDCRRDAAAHVEIADAARGLATVEPSPERAQQLRAGVLAAAHLQVPAPRRHAGFAIAGAVMLAASVVLVVVSTRGDSGTQGMPAYRASVYPHPQARYVRLGTSPDEIVRLVEGALTIEVAPIAPGERFRLFTSDCELETRGTAFDVVVTDDHVQAVHVLRGEVSLRLMSPPRMVVLASGERWTAPIVTAELSRTTAVTPAAVVPTVPPSVVAAPTPHRTPAAQRTTPSASTKMLEPSVTQNTTATSSVAKSPVKRPIEMLFDEGWAALGRKDTRAAASAFERAVRAAPEDPLAEDASFWRATALARTTGEGHAARDALAAFIARYSRSNRAGEASAVLGWLLLEAGDLDGAEARFQLAAKDPVATVRASATKGLATTASRRRR